LWRRRGAILGIGMIALLAWSLWSIVLTTHATKAAYDKIHVGETRSAVKDSMGSPDGHSTSELTGEECVYWLMPDDGLQGESNWQVCFQNGRVTRKEESP